MRRFSSPISNTRSRRRRRQRSLSVEVDLCPALLQDHHELLAPVAGDKIFRSREAICQAVRHLAQDRVSSRMAVGVVYPFEVIDVDHEKRRLAPEQIAQVDDSLEMLVQRGPIVEPRQTVAGRLFAHDGEFASQRLESGAEVLDQGLLVRATVLHALAQHADRFEGFLLQLLRRVSPGGALQSPQPVGNLFVGLLFEDQGVTHARDESPDRLEHVAQSPTDEAVFFLPGIGHEAPQTLQVSESVDPGFPIVSFGRIVWRFYPDQKMARPGLAAFLHLYGALGFEVEGPFAEAAQKLRQGVETRLRRDWRRAI